MSEAGLVGQRYRLLEVIGAGGMGTVYRAKDRLGGLVALKRLTPPPLAPPIRKTPNELAQVAQVAQVAAQVATETGTIVSSAERLVSPVRPTPAGRRSHHLALAREFHVLSSLRHPNVISVLDYGFDDQELAFFTMELLEGAQPMVRAASAEPFSQRVRLLIELLRALRYLHRRGVVHRDLKPSNVLIAGGHVRVLDFGLAALQAELEEDRPGLAGTPAYMAPELFKGRPPSPASDLFAVGVMLYELFAGRPPWGSGSYRSPDLTLLDERVAPLVGRLLAERPDERLSDASDVIRALALTLEVPESIETAATRESALKAAPFVGRGAELLRLNGLLDELLAGRGDAWLIGGESGVGKSRLLEELRALALINGALVLSGQAVSEGGGPYLLWRNVVRWLAILSEPSAAESGILLPLVPDIAALLEQEVRPAAEIDTEAAQSRLRVTIEALLRRVKRPIVLLLEDLQWAGSDSLKLLVDVAALTQQLPILVLATFRDDERPMLTRELVTLKSFKVERLAPGAIAELSRSMMGAAGARPEILRRLQDETEGNPYFLVEMVRAMAEEAGQLDAIGEGALSSPVLTEGMGALVRRRLARLPGEARALLEIAAVAGRRVDPAVLAAVEPGADIEEWLSLCTHAAVVDVAEGQARFAHDKLREGVLAELPLEHRRALHGRIAAAIERIYAHDPTYTAALAHHFARAGDDERGAHYAGLAGEQALSASAYVEAVQLFRRALAHSREHEPGPRRVRWMGRIAEALAHSGDQQGAREVAREILRRLGLHLPGTPAGYLAASLAQAVALVAHRLRADGGLMPDPASRELLGEGGRMLNLLCSSYFYADQPLPMTWSALCAVRVGECAGPSSQLSYAYSSLGVFAGLVRLHPLARAWLRLGIQHSERNGLGPDLARSLHFEAVYLVTVAAWEEFELRARRCLAIAKDNGDRRRLEEVREMLAMGLAYRGCCAEALRELATVDPSVQARADKQSLIWSAQVEALCRLRLGDMPAAQARLERARELVDATTAQAERLNTFGPQALVALRLNDRRGARALAEEALAVVWKKPVVAYWIHHSVDAVADCLLTLWETEEDGPARSSLRELAKRACGVARAFARTFVLGRPSSLLWDGMFARLMRSPRRARAQLERAAALANRLRMPFEEARAHLELGRHAGGTSRVRHLETAERLFVEMGAAAEVARTRDLLARTSKKN